MVLDRPEEEEPAPKNNVLLSLRPTLSTLLWVMERIGFARVEQIHPPADARAANETGGRVMLAGYLH